MDRRDFGHSDRISLHICVLFKAKTMLAATEMTQSQLITQFRNVLTSASDNIYSCIPKSI